ncbi:MAG: hypothetical protein EBS94_10380 [Proteobacteria bacterium]|nr:hypothetical protein [Pseudomonadota bacterium]
MAARVVKNDTVVAPVAISNVAVVCPSCKRGVKVSFKLLADGTKVRTCRKCGDVIEKKVVKDG